MVDQSEYGTNTTYLVDFIQITLSTKLLNNDQIRLLHQETGLSAAQIGARFGVAKSVILARLHDMGIRIGSGTRKSSAPNNYRNRVPPYGYSLKDGKLQPNKAELRVCRQIVNLMKQDGLSANGTGKELARRKIKTRSGRSHWDHSTILSIFNRWKDKL